MNLSTMVTSLFQILHLQTGPPDQSGLCHGAMVRITLEGFGSKDNLWSYGVGFSLHFPSLMPRMFKEGWDEKVPSNHFFSGFVVQL